MPQVNAAGQDAPEQLLNKLFNEGSNNAKATTLSVASAVTQLDDPSVTTIEMLTLAAATPALKLPAPAVGKVKILYVVQDATGSRVPTWQTASGAIKWQGSAAPTLTVTANKVDRLLFESPDGVNWYGSATLNYG